MSRTILKQGLTNHVTFVIDRSGSMAGHKEGVIRAVDAQIQSLAKVSRSLDQETRVTVVIFDDEVDVLVYDKDVLRLPSIAEHYQPRGRTALVDATLQALEDLARIPEIHSDHAFLLFALTDGAENASKNLPSALSRRVSTLGDNWTVAALVPDARGEQYAQRCGFPSGNIMLWDTATDAGFEQAAQTIHRATETFMANRASGIRGSKSVFSMSADTVNEKTVRGAGLKELKPSGYQIVRVAPGDPEKWPKIRDWVREGVGRPFVTGMVHQELVKPTDLGGTKALIIVDNETDRAYGGDNDEVRRLLGLGGNNVRISPQVNKKYSVFVESRSTNRKPVVGQRMLLKF